MALLSLVRRLKRVDFPTLGRPTRARMGRRRGRLELDWTISLETEFRQQVGILSPPLIDPDKELQKDPASQDDLQLFPGLFADLFKHRPLLADEDGLVGLPIRMDRGLDDDEALFFLLGELVDGDRRRIGDLLAGQKKDLLPDDLGGEKTLGLIGHLSLGVIARALREKFFDQIQEDRQSLSLKRADGDNLSRRQQERTALHQGQEPPLGDEIYLIQQDERLRLGPAQCPGDIFILPSHPLGGIDQPEDPVHLPQGLERGLDHAPVDQRTGPVNPRGIEKDGLRAGRRPDTHDAVARGLGLGTHNGDLRSQKLIEQGRLPHVGPAHDGDEARAVLGRFLPCLLYNLFRHRLHCNSDVIMAQEPKGSRFERRRETGGYFSGKVR